MFPIQISLTISTPAQLDQLNAVVSQIYDATVASAPKPPKGTPVEKAAATEAPGKSKDAPAETSAPSEPTAAQADAPEPSTAAPAPQPSTEKPAAAPSAPERAVVSKAAVSLALKDKPKIIEILAGFDGAKGVKDLKDEQLAAAFEQINAALAA